MGSFCYHTFPASSHLLVSDFAQGFKSPKLPYLSKQQERWFSRSQGASKVFAYYGLREPPYKLVSNYFIISWLISLVYSALPRKNKIEIEEGKEMMGKQGINMELLIYIKLDALEPYMSRKTLEKHWGGHHRNYVEGLNKQLEKNEVLYGCTMDELVKVTYNNGNPLPEFNNAAQVWNHDFFWDSMQPGGGDMLKLGVLQQIEKDFGSFTNFREKFVEAALTLFGSGWVWLVLKREERRLAVIKTSNAVCPLVWDDIPIISLDMWEHAYYLDYKNDKGKYVNVFMDHLVSWNVATGRMARAEAFVNLGEPKIPIA